MNFLPNNYLTKTLVILLLTSSCFTFAQAQFIGAVDDGGCATEQVNKAIYEANPNLKAQIKAKLEALKNQTPQHKSGAMMDNVVPVVFHIIPTPCGATFDFTRPDLLSILDEVNVDFAGQNTNEYNASIDPTFHPIRAGDVGLTFRLAEVDPNGNPTDGFTRPTTSFYSYNGGVDRILKDIVRWDNRKYLNVWVVQDVASASGFAHYPYTAIGQPEIDGIVMDKDYMIDGTTEKNRRPNILTHEIGHWLGLLHAWGDPSYNVTDDGTSCPNAGQTEDCDCDDLVNDTPKCEQFNPTVCPSTLPTTCNGSPHNIHNFMDYGCEVMFTVGQKDRMWDMINDNIGGRGEVVTNNNDQSVFMDNRSDQNYAKLHLDKVVFRESDINPGTISETGIIELRNCSGCSFSNNIDFMVSGLPASITKNNIQITRLASDSKKAEISFNINLNDPADHTNDVENISIILNQNAIVGTSQVFNNRTIGGLKIDFRKEELAFSNQSGATFAANDFTAINIPYLGTEVGFSRQSVNDGSIRMYALAPLEAAVTGSNSFNVKRLGDNQSISGESFREITGGASNDPDNLILYKPGVYTDWLNQTGYVGLRANTCGVTYYAWIRIEVTSAGVNILDMVVNLENNAPLNTGQYPSCESPKAENDGIESMYINSVNIGQINNVSGYNGGYQFFTNHTTDLIEGDNYVVNCQDSNPNIAQYEGGEWRVYIDLNGDGSYLNPDDLRYTIEESQNINQVVQLIPPGTLNGQTELNTKMMVVFSLHPLRGICEDYQYGETEEYNVTIKASGGTGQTYCEPTGQHSQIYISNVSLQEINNPSGNDGYANYTNQVANLSQGQSYTLSVTESTPWNFYWRGWIDYNQNGTFENSELVLSANNASGTYEENFIVPANALAGNTRMRVYLKYFYDAAPTPCENIGLGEVEDYTINIGGGPSCNVGASCNDNDVCTVGDVYDSNCNCVGTYVDADGDGTCQAEDCDDNDASIPAAPGTTCNDGNPNTTGDVIQADGCTCEGQATTSCNAAVPTSGNLSTGAYSSYAYGYCNGHGGSNKEFELTNLATGSTSTYTSTSHYALFQNLTSSTNYRFRVRLECGNTGTYGDWSPYENFTTTAGSCNAAVPAAGDLSDGGGCTYAYGYCNGHSGINKQFELTNLATGAVSTHLSTSHYASFNNLTPSTGYQFRVRLECGNTGTYGGWSTYEGFVTTACKTETEILNLRNYPNPFDDYTTIEFSLPDDSPVTLRVYDLTGRQVTTLLDDELKPAGPHRVIFNGSEHPSGMYIYKIQVGEYIGTGKMNIIK